MDATCAIQNSIHVFSLVHINMCPGFWVHIIPVVEAWGVFVTKVWERDWKIRQIESGVKDERVVYVKKEQKREFVW